MNAPRVTVVRCTRMHRAEAIARSICEHFPTCIASAAWTARGPRVYTDATERAVLYAMKRSL